MKRLSEDARRTVLVSASAEAHRLGSDRIGTEHLFLAVTGEFDSLSKQVLGVDLSTARRALTDMDRQAMRNVGIDATSLDRPRTISGRRRPPFTSGARKVLKAAVDHAREETANVVTERDLLRSLLTLARPDPAAGLIDALDINRDEAIGKLESDGVGG